MDGRSCCLARMRLPDDYIPMSFKQYQEIQIRTYLEEVKMWLTIDCQIYAFEETREYFSVWG